MNSSNNLIERIFELQKKLDESLIDETASDSLLYSLLHMPQLVKAIKNIEQGETTIIGRGVDKVGYKFLNYIILKEKIDYTVPLSTKKEITQKLRSIGVQTPPIIFHSSRDKLFDDGYVNDLYEVQQFAKGSPIGFSMSYRVIDYANALENKKVYGNSEPDNKKLVAKYNLEMLKKRALTGAKHAENFVKNYAILSSLNALDFHGGNILYNENSGYTFIDLVYDTLLKFNEQKDLVGFVNNALISNPPNYNILFDILDGSLLFSRTHNAYTFNLDKSRYFENFIFSGIVMQQCINAINNSTSPILDSAKEFLGGIHPNSIDQKFFGANPSTLNVLYKGIKENDSRCLDCIRNQFDIPNNFNFQTMFDCESFIKAMDITREMNNSHNNINQSNMGEM